MFVMMMRLGWVFEFSHAFCGKRASAGVSKSNPKLPLREVAADFESMDADGNVRH